MRSTGTAWGVKGELEANKIPEAETQGELNENEAEASKPKEERKRTFHKRTKSWTDLRRSLQRKITQSISEPPMKRSEHPIEEEKHLKMIQSYKNGSKDSERKPQGRSLDSQSDQENQPEQSMILRKNLMSNREDLPEDLKVPEGTQDKWTSIEVPVEAQCKEGATSQIKGRD